METEIKQYEIPAVFNRFFKGHQNIMTPNVIKYGNKRQFVYEISSGIGMFGDMIYGLTVLEFTKHAGIQHRHNLSDMHRSLESAKNAVTELDKS